jgi:signal transduction histidine kinase
MALEASSSYNVVAGSDASLGLATLFKKEHTYDSCYYYARKGFGLAQQVNRPDLIEETSKFLKEFFKEKNILDSAFSYQEIMIAANDSMHSVEKINRVHVISFAEQQRAMEAAMQKKEFQNKIKQYTLVVSLLVFLIIAFLLYRNNRHKQKANILLEHQKQEVQHALTELKITQAQLIQSEKMASLGELTAGIAHEIQNPLNFVNNFSDVNTELVDELKSELAVGNMQSAAELAESIKENEQKINLHGKRADAIVKGMLQHSRSGTGHKALTDINALADEYLRLAYHGFRAKDKSFNAKIETSFDNTLDKINIVQQDIGRAILNLINNAFYAVNEKQKQNLDGYEPTVTVSTAKENGKVVIKVADNGIGVPPKIADKIFQPFFTTKPAGQGTGLGLSLAYDIITKGHGGELKVETKENEGSEFTIKLSLG